MKRRKKRIPVKWSVVATAHTQRGLREAASLRPGNGVDLVEVRLDCLAPAVSRLRAAIQKIRLPVILTARHPKEGGCRGMGDAGRAALLELLIPLAAYIDVELRSMKPLAAVIAQAKRSGVRTILSFHDFSGTPGAARLRAKSALGLRHGASIVKIATTLRGPGDLAALIDLQSKSGDLAVMGMGPLGKVSRLVLPLAGARLVYGYLDRPQVDGQWPAQMIADLLSELAQ